MTMETTKPLVLEALEVRYGRKVAVDRVSLALAPGEVYALLGRNGAGKSSLVRCLLGQQRPQSGGARLLGRDVWRDRAALMAEVGVVPEDPDVPGDLSPRQVSATFGPLYPRWDEAGFFERLHRQGLSPDQAFGDLSRGQKAQVALGLALAHQPRVLVLDDPTLGLDAVARRSFFEELVGDLADRGTTVFLTSHDLAGVEGLADRVGFLQAGRLVLDEPLEALKARFRRVRWDGHPPELEPLAPLQQDQRPWGREAVVTAYDEDRFAPLRARGAEADAMSLEDIFVALMAGGEVMA